MSESSKSHTRTRSISRSPLRGPPRPSWSQNAVRQLKLIIPGAMVTYYLDTVDKFMRVLQAEESSWQSKAALLAFGNGVVMILLFICILVMIYLKGEHLDWRNWRRSGPLSLVIPVLTATIIIGWLLHVLVLGRWSDMGYFQGFVGATALYALVFGLLALIPAPGRSGRH